MLSCKNPVGRASDPKTRSCFLIEHSSEASFRTTFPLDGNPLHSSPDFHRTTFDTVKPNAFSCPESRKIMFARMEKTLLSAFPSEDMPSLRDALSRYLQEVTDYKKGKSQETRRIHAWQTHPLGTRPLDQIRRMDLVAYRNERRDQGRSAHTIRLDLAVLSHLYEIARSEWGYETLTNPVKAIRLPAFPPGRDRRLEPGELEKILLHSAPTMSAIVRFAIETAMRRSEILSLTWDQVDLDRRIALLKDTKAGGRRKVPLSPLALSILKERKMTSSSPNRIFSLSADDVSHRFLDSCRKAGISDLRFHDLRHEATSRLFEKGLSIPQVAAITGHKTLQMLHRYTHLRAEDLARTLADLD